MGIQIKKTSNKKRLPIINDVEEMRPEKINFDHVEREREREEMSNDEI